MTWTYKESANYVFNYKSGSFAEGDIEKIKEIQEKCYKHICKTFGGKLCSKIEYYLCDTPSEVGELYGDNEPCNGFARRPNKVYAVYNEEVKCIGFHEDAHIVSYEVLGIPEEVFLREGLVMFLDKGYKKISNETWVKFFIEKDKYIHIKELMKNHRFYEESPDITYPISGAFVEYLISTYGLEKFKEFYRNKNEKINERVLEVYKIDIEVIEEDFKDYICCSSLGTSLIEV